MKNLILAVLLVFSLSLESSVAQITPDIDHDPTDLSGVKTDPVLSNPLEMIFVKTDPVLKPYFTSDGLSLNLAPQGVAGPSLNFAAPDKLRSISVNAQPIFDLIRILEKSGAKVETRIVQNDGVSILEVKVNGLRATSMTIEFEY